MRAEHLHSSGLVYMAESPRRQASSRPADVEAVCAPPPFGCHLRCTEQPAASSVPPSAPSTLLGRQGGSKSLQLPARLTLKAARPMTPCLSLSFKKSTKQPSPWFEPRT